MSTHLPNDDALDGMLHRAVEAVRSEAIPREAVDRAIHQAAWRIAASRRRSRLLAVGVGLAAACVLVALASPMFQKVRESSNRSWAQNNLRPLGLGVDTEVTDTSDIGLGSGHRDYAIDRIEEIAVPSPVDPTEALGLNAPTQPVAPPPGTGIGTGAVTANPTRPQGQRSGLTTSEATLRALIQRMEATRSRTPGSVSDDDYETAKLQLKRLEEEARRQSGGESHATEQYRHFHDNPFLRPRTAPLSTFGITVDTASYSNVRRFLLQENRLPPADAVRVAELVNYFPYQYPQPRGEHPVAFSLALAECPWQPKHHLVRIALKGKQLDPRQMPARNFVFLLDTSGSMNAENRLPLLKASLALLTEQLTAQDRVAIVAYAGSAGLVLPSTPGNQKDAILRALERLESGGSTNGGEGIQLAYKIARENFLQGGVNRVILGTDGDFNVGTTSEGELVRLIEEQRLKGGVYLTILGFGMGNLKDGTMERLAHHGHGHFAYIDTLTEARKQFLEQGGALVTLAKDVKLQVEFNPQRVGAYRLIGYENKLLRAQDFNDDAKHAGTIGSGHTVTALYEIVPPGLPIPQATGVDPLKYQEAGRVSAASDGGEWLTVKLRYKDPEADASKLLTQPLVGPVVKLADAPADLRFAAAVAAFGQLLRQSNYRGQATYATAADLARGALGDDPGGHRAEFLRLVETASRLTAAQEN